MRTLKSPNQLNQVTTSFNQTLSRLRVLLEKIGAIDCKQIDQPLIDNVLAYCFVYFQVQVILIGNKNFTFVGFFLLDYV